MKKKPTEQSTNLMQNEQSQSLFVPQFKRKTAAPKRTMLLTVKPVRRWKEEHLFTMAVENWDFLPVAGTANNE